MTTPVSHAKASVTGKSSKPAKPKPKPSRAQPAARSSSSVSPVQHARESITGSKSRSSRSPRGRSNFGSSSGPNSWSDMKPPGGFHLIDSSKGSKTTTLIAEWLIACVLIIVSVFDGTNEYLDAMHDALMRLLAVSAVYFCLALLMRGKGTSKVAVAFGGIIDLALVLNLGKKGTFDSIAKMFTASGTGGQTITAADVTTQALDTSRATYTTSSESAPGEV